ncbi:VCL family protein [Megaselia abdita]
MSGFHTKTIKSILEPVAEQVSRLVILHEETENEKTMPDLSHPVQAVSLAVSNLVNVGRGTINSSTDEILKQDMPAALTRVENSAQLLVEATSMLKNAPSSAQARKKLIDGSRGILQGTSALLCCLDECMVRKIIQECKRVLHYLTLTEIMENEQDLEKFITVISKSDFVQQIESRRLELTHQVHSDILGRCIKEYANLLPILFDSMKLYILLALEQQAPNLQTPHPDAIATAADNRNYLAMRMSDEVQEIIRVLQLTTYDEDTSELDNITVLKKICNSIHTKTPTAIDWLNNPYALNGGFGEKALRQIIDDVHRVADHCLPQDALPIRKMADDITTMANALCELRQDGKGRTPQAEALAREIREKLGNLNDAVLQAVMNLDKAGVQQTAHTIKGRLEQACKWLKNPNINDKGLGQRAIGLIVNEGRKVADGCPGHQKAEIQQLCNEVENLSDKYSQLCARGLGNTPEAQATARLLNEKLHELKAKIQSALVNRVVEDFMDVSTPLEQFIEAVNEGIRVKPFNEENFNHKANNLTNFSDRAAKTSRMVAASASGGNKRIAEALLASAAHIDSLTPQLISAGKIRVKCPWMGPAEDHLLNLKKQYADTILRMRSLCEQAIDISDFIKASEEQMKKYAFLCEDAIGQKNPQKMVDNTSNIARLVNRVLWVAKMEVHNSENPEFTAKIKAATAKLEEALPHMVQCAKGVALNINDPNAAHAWRESNKKLLNAVRNVGNAVVHTPEVPQPPDMSALRLNEYEHAPPRPPLPMEPQFVPARPPPPAETDDDEDAFRAMPHANQPILIAARGLHQEVRQWESEDNEIIKAAKRMAKLMARLSELVNLKGSKSELIATAKAIAEASEDVTRIAKDLARRCTDIRIRTNLLQVCERIPTIGTQLKILSTVKATMLGAQGSEEDREATDMLVGNAQNLMKSVTETVRVAEGASIKIRYDQTHYRMRWVRRDPWYHN